MNQILKQKYTSKSQLNNLKVNKISYNRKIKEQFIKNFKLPIFYERTISPSNDLESI